MNISFRIRRTRTVAGAAVLALAVGGLATALPARASAGPAATREAIGNAVVTDSLTTGDVTAPDAILTCATSQIYVGGTEAVVIPVGCFTQYNGEWVKVTWSGTGLSTELTQQTDGNLVLHVGNGSVWAAGTTFVRNFEGPGCLTQFQSNANLVVSNCDAELIWNSNTRNYPFAVLAFQADGNLVIYANPAGTPLWASGT